MYPGWWLVSPDAFLFVSVCVLGEGGYGGGVRKMQCKASEFIFPFFSRTQVGEAGAEGRDCSLPPLTGTSPLTPSF